ncbi:hypothetical protein A2W24_02395 [Microgenomates group bacterium RBG_16_45_19]|nr:MAG: hypothetical protein A2W24_02395 [Microgenomates group bacterium RBG_16_45_19]
MDNTSVIQVRLPESLREASEKRAGEVGLSSVQEAIRLFLKGFVEKRVGLALVPEKFPPEKVVLSKAAQKRFARIENDLDEGRNTISFDDPQEALKWLIQSSK